MNILSMENITKSFGDRPLFDRTSFYLQEGEKAGIIGINGTGKSTLLKMMAGLEEPDEGSMTIANHVVCSYLSQHPLFQEKDTVMEAVQRRCGAEAAQVKSMLTRLGVTDFEAVCGSLSGGQQKRLALVAALLEPSDLLILDEPTNDLDITTLAILEDYLDSFSGIVIAVSHDRYFLDRIAKRLFAFSEGGVLKQYEGGYTDYKIRMSQEAGEKESVWSAGSQGAGKAGKSKADAYGKEIVPQGQEPEKGTGEAEQNKKNSWKQSDKKLKFTYKEQKDYEAIEGEIAALEETISSLDEQIVKAATDFVKLNELTRQKQQTEKELEEKMDRWMYLEDLKARIDAQ